MPERQRPSRTSPPFRRPARRGVRARLIALSLSLAACCSLTAEAQARPLTLRLSVGASAEGPSDVQVEGHVRDGEGNGVECAVVSLLREKELVAATATDADGYFAIRGQRLMPNVEYVARVDAPGYLEPQARTFNYSAGAISTLNFAVAPDPRDARKIPVNRGNGVSVVLENKYADQGGLTAWLDDMAKGGNLIRTIIPLRPEVSLFVFERASAGTLIQTQAQTGVKTEFRNAVEANRETFRKKTFVGLHRLGSGAFLMVYYE